MDVKARESAISAIKVLKEKYFSTLDAKDDEGLRSVWAEDVVVDALQGVTDPTTGYIVAPGLGDEIMRGADTITRKLLHSLERISSEHQGTIVRIEVVDENHAHGVWQFSDKLSFNDSAYTAVAGNGQYEETYERVGGEWKIKTMRVTRSELDYELRPLYENVSGSPRILVLYYSSYGHIEQMAEAIAEGARSGGARVDLKRVPETAPPEVARGAGFKLDQAADVASIEQLAEYDAIILGAPTRFGRMPSQMAAFLDQAGGLWVRGLLNGKVGAAFTSTASQHGGQEATLFSMITNLLHFGMVIVGLPYNFVGQLTLGEVSGGSPYGATTLSAGDGSRMPSTNELNGARFQGRHVAEVAAKLFC